MENTLYEAWSAVYKDAELVHGMWRWPGDFLERHTGETWLEHYRTQRRLQRQYAWAIPSPEVIIELAWLGPIVEIGAGRGYWAALINDAGGDVVCYDAEPPDQSTENGWAPPVGHHDDVEVPVTIETAVFTEVRRGGPEKVLEHQDRALFLCWPPYDDPMAYDALRQYEGELLIYVGEGEGGCTGDDYFHKLVGEQFEQIRYMELPFWDGLHDALWIYKRKPTARRA